MKSIANGPVRQNLDRWVPTYPGRSQIHAYSLNMGFAEMQAGEGLRINLVARGLIIWVDGGAPRSPEFCLEDTNSGEKWWIHLHTSEDVSKISNSLHYPTCLLMNERYVRRYRPRIWLLRIGSGAVAHQTR